MAEHSRNFPTIEDSYKKHDEFGGKARILDILDTAGMAEYSSLRSQYMQNAMGFILVYSIIQLKTFQDIEPLITQIYEVKQKQPDSKSIPIVICGNKLDLDGPGERAVTTEQGQQLADKYGAKFLECSAKTGQNVRDAFQQLVELVDQANPKRSQKKSSCPFL